MTLASNNQEMYWGQNTLPPSYKRVAYLESRGSQWIDTGVDGGSDIAISGEFLRTTAEGIMWGCIDVKSPKQNTLRCMLQCYSQGPFGYFTDTNTSAIGFDGIFNSKFLASADYPVGAFSIGTSTNTATIISYEMPLSIYIFARHRRGVVPDIDGICPAGYRIYGMQIKKAGAWFRNYVPCIRTADGKPGLFDLCGSICPLTNTPFYINSGGADFTWGELQ